jgi:general stress protein YciG
VIGGAVKDMRIATGEEEDEREPDKARSAAAENGRLGGAARARNLSAEQKAEIGRKGARATVGAQVLERDFVV